MEKPIRFLRSRLAEICVCLIAALAYVGTLGYGFVYDDVLLILRNPALRDWHHVPQYFNAHLLGTLYPSAGGNYYRPLVLLWMRLNYAMFKTNPIGWHASTVSCHIVATCLVFKLAERITGQRRVALIAALLFALHPAHIESVAWISGVSDPLMSCFFLGSVLAFFQWRKSAGKIFAALSFALYAAALLAKETAIVIPAVIFVAAWFEDAWFEVPGSENEWRATGRTETERPRTTRGGDLLSSNLRNALRMSSGYIVIAFLYFGLRNWALHGFSHPLPASWSQMFLTWPSVAWFYIHQLIIPFSIGEFHSLSYSDHATLLEFWAPLSALCLFLVLGWALTRRLLFGTPKPRGETAWFAAVLIIAPLLPVFDLRVLTAGDVVHERYLYLPSVGFVILIALALLEIDRRAGHGVERGPAQRVTARALFFSRGAWATVALIAVGFAVLTLTQQKQWSSDVALYYRGVETAPDNLTVRDNLGNALLAAGQPVEAISKYKEVLVRNPDFWRSNYNLGVAYYRIGEGAAAERSLERAIAIDDRDPDQFIYLALAQLRLNKLKDAQGNARQAIARDPQAPGYHLVLGLIAKASVDEGAAFEAFRAETELYPDNVAARLELQKPRTVATKFTH